MSIQQTSVPKNTDIIDASRWISCHECAYPIKLPPLPDKHKALCPRCGFHITSTRKNALQWVGALVITAQIFLALSLPFDFLSFSVGGQSQNIDILGSIWFLFEQDYAILGLLEVIAIVVLPATILLTISWVVLPLLCGIVVPRAKQLVNLIFAMLPWAMAEIFLIGVLVSVVKISSMADVSIGPSFYAYLSFTVCLTATLMFLDEHQLRRAILDTDGPQTKPINPAQSIQKTWALLFTAILLYIPANILPIMITTTLGSENPSTIIGGVILLWQSGSYPIALVIFVASIVVPVAKLVILCWLNFSVQLNVQQHKIERMRWYRLTEFIGRWSMIDIFVVVVLVSLIQLGNVMSIHPGHAAIAFCAVVIITMLAAMSFDTRLIWNKGPTFK